MEDGQRITFVGESDQTPGLPPGDVIIVLDEKEHPVFKRAGTDLLLNLVLRYQRFCNHCWAHKSAVCQEITLVEALCGFKRVITHLDDRQVLIQAKPGQVINDGMSEYWSRFILMPNSSVRSTI
jgi:DnaJ-class molecular chaperone